MNKCIAINIDTCLPCNNDKQYPEKNPQYCAEHKKYLITNILALESEKSIKSKKNKKTKKSPKNKNKLKRKIKKQFS